MKIELKEFLVSEVYAGYRDNAENGVIAYNGKLNVRPAYQREFVYKDDKRNAVIETINNNFPLNVMYWIDNEDGNYELLDGQQRTLSICQYINGDFSIKNRTFHNLTKAEKDNILGYKLMIYVCKGNDKEKLDWFKIINTAGEKLTEQELRNAIYTGPWLSDAKLKFSKTGCPAYQLSEKYVTGVPIRQELLQTAIKWANDGKIEEYMSKHQHDPNANELWTEYRNIIEWVKDTFTTYRKEMKSVDWGPLYYKYHKKVYDTKELEQKISNLMMDDDVQSKKGIYSFILSGEERDLSIRSFTDNQKRQAYEKQKGICYKCNKHFELKDMEADHITPWSKGGKTIAENCNMLCKECNRRKSDV